MKHIYFHVVPKYKDGPSWGKTFDMVPENTVLLNEEDNEIIDKIKRNL